MERYIRLFLLSILMMFGFINMAFASSVATSFQLPMDDYPVDDNCLAWGGYNSGYSGRHVADDACASAGTNILAVANGVVKFAGPYKPCSNYGNWGYLIIIEHTLVDESVVNSIYGHISPINGITVGVEVTKGQHIGEIVSMSCWSDHIHFGVYDGPYSEITCSYNANTGSGSCNTHGYISDWPGNYVDPTDFISSHQTSSDPSTFIPFINARADAPFQQLNPYCGISNEKTPASKMLGYVSNETHWWNDASTTSYNNGVANNTVLRNYDGGDDTQATSYIIEDWRRY